MTPRPAVRPSQLRHQKVDRRRRERERRAFLQLAELLAQNKGEQVAHISTRSLRLPLDKVTLLETACSQLRAFRQSQSQLSSVPSILGNTSSPLHTSPSQLPVRLQSSTHPLVGLTAYRSLLWARHLPEEDISGEVTKYLHSTSLRDVIQPVLSDMFSVTVAPASCDPEMIRALEAASMLLRGERATAEIDLACPTEELGNWMDMHGAIRLAVPHTYHHREANLSHADDHAIDMSCMLVMHNCVFAFEQSFVEFLH